MPRLLIPTGSTYRQSALQTDNTIFRVVKESIDHISFAKEVLGLVPDRSGMCRCLTPRHPDKTPSMSIGPSGFYCFGCGWRGDAMDALRVTGQACSVKEALNQAAAYAGVQIEELDEDEVEAYRQAREKKARQWEVLELAARQFEAWRDASPWVLDHLKGKWGLEAAFVRAERIGYSESGGGCLLEALGSQGVSESELIQLGLMTEPKEDRKAKAFFRGRIVFPYIDGGRVEYFIGRWTEKTPNWPSKEIDPETGKPVAWGEDPRKYVKLAVAKAPGDRGVPDNPLWGQEVLRDRRADVVVFTEGIADALAAKQAGLSVVSPVTVTLNTRDLDRYVPHFAAKSRVVIINDSEESGRGAEGAITVAEHLEVGGANVRTVDLPRSDGVEKIDLADYLRVAEDPQAAAAALLGMGVLPLEFEARHIQRASIDEADALRQIENLSGWDRYSAVMKTVVASRIAAWFPGVPGLASLLSGQRAVDNTSDVSGSAQGNPMQKGAAGQPIVDQWVESSPPSPTSVEILTASEEADRFEQEIQKFQGQRMIGLETGTFPLLDDALLGFRGLNLLAAPPGLGKTTFLLQTSWDLLAKHLDACVVIVSLEMRRRELHLRLRCRIGRQDYRDLLLNQSQEPDELAKRQECLDLFKGNSDRLLILDRQNLPDLNLASLLQAIQHYREMIGAQRVFLMVDYLQVWTPSGEGEAISELNIDKMKIAEMQALRDGLTDDDAVVVISEARKPPGGTRGWASSMADVMGSARAIYTPDVVLLMQKFEDEDLAKEFRLSSSNAQGMANLRGELLRLRRTYNWLKIVKGRDGVDRKDIKLTFNYAKSYFTEGIDRAGLSTVVGTVTVDDDDQVWEGR